MASLELTDPRSARVRRLRRLARRASRADERRFLVEGAQAVREALGAHRAETAHVVELIVSASAADRQPELITSAHDTGIPICWASDAVLAALSETVTPQGLVAVVDFLDLSLDSVVDRGPRLVAVLADVRDPGNAGSVLRVADAAGADAVVFAGDSIDPYNGKAVRASVGSLFHVPVVTGVSITSALAELRGAGLALMVTDATGEQDLYSSEALDRPVVWVFGNEAWGVPGEVIAEADAVVRIPIYGRAESLNVATAAALCLYASARAQNS